MTALGEKHPRGLPILSQASTTNFRGSERRTRADLQSGEAEREEGETEGQRRNNQRFSYKITESPDQREKEKTVAERRGGA